MGTVVFLTPFSHVHMLCMYRSKVTQKPHQLQFTTRGIPEQLKLPFHAAAWVEPISKKDESVVGHANCINLRAK